jgi:transcriptional regulator with XRE-family HTH domain
MKAREYNSPILQDLLEEVTPLEMEQTSVKMQLAANIENHIRSKGWSKTRFASELNKSQPEISKWLSGAHNFTVETLVQISQVLGVEIAALFAKNQVKEVYSNTFSAASYQYITYSMKNYAVNENSVSYGDKPI